MTEVETYATTKIMVFLGGQSPPCVQVVPYNAKRRALIMASAAGNSFVPAAPGDLQTAIGAGSAGIQLGGGLPIIFNSRDHPGLTRSSWWVWMPAADNITVIEDIEK
jgi:hypothetical protein